MILEAARFQAPPTSGVERLVWSDVLALDGLYADGISRGEAPDFFFPSMVERGVFFGIREGTELIAAAGTHLVTEEEDVAAVGNVYTRADRRARGHGMSVTAAVVHELIARRIGVIALQVLQSNAPAIRLYERLGFVRYCTLIEGIARPLGAVPA